MSLGAGHYLCPAPLCGEGTPLLMKDCPGSLCPGNHHTKWWGTLWVWCLLPSLLLLIIFCHYTILPFPPHLCPSSLFSLQSHPKHRGCCRCQLPLSLPSFFPAETSCISVHTIPSFYLLLLHSLIHYSSVWFSPLTGCWCGINPSHKLVIKQGEAKPSQICRHLIGI